ncbi:cytochrome-c peroxidase [Bremerella cremea]|uniref:Cytochrome-c peroxidase n=1 Tax=Bremerella cremea TaxID=1031537 RepID=A0A368KR53_9BACT|nr:cytochrome c peroxidase [Bremerella cremea]RCS49286.1 cytochrome-c peroxidase [Bremerella cremea]
MPRFVFLFAWFFLLIEPAHLPAQSTYLSDVPLGIDWIIIPDDNQMSDAKIELGKQLFFDPRLSGDQTVSCATCHDPNHGWADKQRFSQGVRGEKTSRNVPSIVNVGLHRTFFWDGRAASLEEQALFPLENRAEMDIRLDQLEQRLHDIAGYRRQFDAIFPDGVTAKNVGRALAAFQRTILAGETPYDQFRGGHADALDGEIGVGNGLFFGKAHCGNCHIAKVYTDHQFHNIGSGLETSGKDRGLAERTGRQEDVGKFRTPLLRDLALTAPYFHDGSKATLEDVVDFYNEGGGKNPNLDPHIVPLNLTAAEKQALVTFLREGLRSRDYPHVEKPLLPE